MKLQGGYRFKISGRPDSTVMRIGVPERLSISL